MRWAYGLVHDDTVAEAIGLGSSKGWLQPGLDGDVFVVDGDLSAGLGALRDMRQVVVHGHTHDPPS